MNKHTYQAGRAHSKQEKHTSHEYIVVTQTYSGNICNVQMMTHMNHHIVYKKKKQKKDNHTYIHSKAEMIISTLV